MALSRIVVLKKQQNDDFDEDEGFYDDLNLDEEEEKFGRLVVDDHEGDESNEANEGTSKFYV